MISCRFLITLLYVSPSSYAFAAIFDLFRRHADIFFDYFAAMSLMLLFSLLMHYAGFFIAAAADVFAAAYAFIIFHIFRLLH